jgi:hypothetical protein
MNHFDMLSFSFFLEDFKLPDYSKNSIFPIFTQAKELIAFELFQLRVVFGNGFVKQSRISNS